MSATAPTHRPTLRGWSHAIACPVWIAAGAWLLWSAHSTTNHRLLLAVYVVGTGVMFATSALYHRVRWSPSAKALMQRFDRSAIFLAIAGGYTPVAWVCLHGWERPLVLAVAWTGATLGIVLHWTPGVHRALRGASYIVVSWIAVFTFPNLQHVLGTHGFALILAGGVCYTIGALSLATRWPDPWPTVFGFHEVFHAFTVVAAALQFAAIHSTVVPLL